MMVGEEARDQPSRDDRLIQVATRVKANPITQFRPPVYRIRIGVTDDSQRHMIEPVGVPCPDSGDRFRHFFKLRFRREIYNKALQ